MLTNNDADAEVVFEYTGEGCVVPKDVTIVRFHPSVVEVENEAFHNCNILREVTLNEGLYRSSEAWAVLILELHIIRKRYSSFHCC